MFETRQTEGARREVMENGANVTIDVKFIRHGERTTDGELTDYGRDVTKQRAQESGIAGDDNDAAKAGGSNADPSARTQMGRSVETAHIYAQEIAGEDAYATRPQQRFSQSLNYENIVSARPYDHRAVYNANLPENFKELSDAEKVVAAKKAQTETLNYVMKLDTPEAKQWKKEAAGAYAAVVEHYLRQAEKLKSGSRVLRPEGSHGGMMEWLLKEALVRKDVSGTTKVGFQTLEEIGGDFDPSEAYTVHVATDAQGEPQTLTVTFDNKNRPATETMHLDIDKVKELTAFYRELHKESV